MKKISLLLTLVIALCSSLDTQAQDIHFSQFYLSPLNLNPALTGVMNCNKRLVANFRNQWASVLRDKAYNTYSASYDQRIAVGRYDNFGIGGSLWGDKAGTVQFAQTQARLSLSYAKYMGGYRKRRHYLVAGADAGINQTSIDFLRATWGVQGLNGIYDPTIPSGEDNLNTDNLIYPDLSAGLLWFTILDDRNNFFLGAAFSHINRANQSFETNGLVPKYTKLTAHAGGEFMFNDRVGVVPGVVAFFQGPSMEVNTGASLKFVLGTNRALQQALQFGIWARIANKNPSGILTDALILSSRFDYNEFSLGFSYDVNVSSLRPASSGAGGFEFALVYKICGKETRKVYCPNF